MSIAPEEDREMKNGMILEQIIDRNALRIHDYEYWTFTKGKIITEYLW